MSWEDDQKFEKDWWGDCSNTFTEETKQLTYGYKMGLQCYSNNGKWPCYNLDGKSVLDIGGGPVSILLKCENRGPCRVVDPCRYPTWIRLRYMESGIEYLTAKGEDVYSHVEGNEIHNKILSGGKPVNGTWKNGKFQSKSRKSGWDEVWIYNVLQHTEDPELIIQNAKNVAPVIRIFEWIDIPAHEGHPQELKEENLNEWLDGKGTTEWLDENGCHGRSYYGVFTNHST